MPAGGPGSNGGKMNGPIGKEGPTVKGFGNGDAVDTGPTMGTGLVKSGGVLGPSTIELVLLVVQSIISALGVVGIDSVVVLHSFITIR